MRPMHNSFRIMQPQPLIIAMHKLTHIHKYASNLQKYEKAWNIDFFAGNEEKKNHGMYTCNELLQYKYYSYFTIHESYNDDPLRKLFFQCR